MKCKRLFDLCMHHSLHVSWLLLSTCRVSFLSPGYVFMIQFYKWDAPNVRMQITLINQLYFILHTYLKASYTQKENICKVRFKAELVIILSCAIYPASEQAISLGEIAASCSPAGRWGGKDRGYRNHTKTKTSCSQPVYQHGSRSIMPGYKAVCMKHGLHSRK